MVLDNGAKMRESVLVNITEACRCGANITVDDTTQTSVSQGMRDALADFRVGHSCAHRRTDFETEALTAMAGAVPVPAHGVSATPARPF